MTDVGSNSSTGRDGSLYANGPSFNTAASTSGNTPSTTNPTANNSNNPASRTAPGPNPNAGTNPPNPHPGVFLNGADQASLWC